MELDVPQPGSTDVSYIGKDCAPGRNFDCLSLHSTTRLATFFEAHLSPTSTKNEKNSAARVAKKRLCTKRARAVPVYDLTAFVLASALCPG